MLELNADQKRNFLSTLEYVDKLLSDCERVFSTARSPSFLPEYVCDISREQHQKMLEYIANFRAEAGGILKQPGLMPPQARKSAVGTVLTYLLFADMALEEIDSKNINHGRLSKDTAQELDMVVSRIRRLVRHMRGYLGQAGKNLTQYS